jgi:hypothetical protein
MSWINMKSRRSFDFTAPYSEEGERLVTVPFPVAVRREAVDGEIVHDANPALVTVSPSAALTLTVEPSVQPGSLLVIRNEGTAGATVAGVACVVEKVTTLMYDGNGYVSIGNTTIA